MMMIRNNIIQSFAALQSSDDCHSSDILSDNSGKPEMQATVPVKSEWLSKINWTAAASLGASVVTYFGTDLDSAHKAAVIATINAAGAFLTIIWRTWFNGTVGPRSMR